jgi:hypothetical protein
VVFSLPGGKEKTLRTPKRKRLRQEWHGFYYAETIIFTEVFLLNPFCSGRGGNAEGDDGVGLKQQKFRSGWNRCAFPSGFRVRKVSQMMVYQREKRMAALLSGITV